MNDYQVLQINLSEAWRSKGLCITSKTKIDFFAESKQEIKLAKSVCNECPVAHECLEFAVRNGEKFGIWGGRTPRERMKIARTVVNLTKEEARSLVIEYGNKVLS
jgi:WhiB family redox-sensing transcriptional regulator